MCVCVCVFVCISLCVCVGLSVCVWSGGGGGWSASFVKTCGLRKFYILNELDVQLNMFAYGKGTDKAKTLFCHM